jgi:hypothetical protein
LSDLFEIWHDAGGNQGEIFDVLYPGDFWTFIELPINLLTYTPHAHVYLSI